MFQKKIPDPVSGKLVQELHALRSTIDVIIDHYGMNVKARVEEMLRTLEGKDVIGEDQPHPDKKAIEKMLLKVRDMKVKPKKGRLKDLKRIGALLDELSKLFPASR
jgi:hypothetical protein